MRILIVHNHYGRYVQGGEANVVTAEAALLSRHGHEVRKYERTNSEIYEDGSIQDKVRLLYDVAWSDGSYHAIKKELTYFRPDIMHVHNYWFVLTPSIFAAAKECRISTVLTLHNYRLICPGGQLLRNNKVCELCIRKTPYRILYHRCYPGRSFLKSYLSLVLYSKTKKSDYFQNEIGFYIALTEFGKSKFIEGGLPSSKIAVKPNFIDDPLGHTLPTNPSQNGAFFAGRISAEKGILTLLNAWRDQDYPLRIAGDGPLLPKLKRNAFPSVEFLGWQPQSAVFERLKQSSFFIFPSELYEGFGLSLLEAMALGKAVIASDLGPRREMIEDGVSGLLFKAGDAADLRMKCELLIRDRILRERLGRSARETFLRRYTPEKNYHMLMDIYNRACS